MNVNLHIERLSIDESLLKRGQRDALHAAVTAELTRLLTDGNLSAAWLNGGAVPSLPGGAIQAGPPASPEHLGAQIGQSVYSAMTAPVNGSAR
jgi:hypothetical protein